MVPKLTAQNILRVSQEVLAQPSSVSTPKLAVGQRGLPTPSLRLHPPVLLSLPSSLRLVSWPAMPSGHLISHRFSSKRHAGLRGSQHQLDSSQPHSLRALASPDVTISICTVGAKSRARGATSAPAPGLAHTGVFKVRTKQGQTGFLEVEALSDGWGDRVPFPGRRPGPLRPGLGVLRWALCARKGPDVSEVGGQSVKLQ